MATFQKLAKKIKTDLGIEVYELRRCYHSNHQLSSGAYSWTGKIVSGGTVCSTVSATDLLKNDILETVEDIAGRSPTEIEII